jgi:hypothetical protein
MNTIMTNVYVVWENGDYCELTSYASGNDWLARQHANDPTGRIRRAIGFNDVGEPIFEEEKTMIDMNKRYTTRDGKPVRILCTDRKGGVFPVCGLVRLSSEEEVPMLWRANGRYFATDEENANDLVEIVPCQEWAIDTPVYVREGPDHRWNRRHFAGVAPDGRAMTWSGGLTSWTYNRKHTCEVWSEVRVATDEAAERQYRCAVTEDEQ